MKEIKYLLLCMYVSGYTSLWWATFIWDGLRAGPNDMPVGIVVLAVLTVVNLAFAVDYCKDNWRTA